MSGFDFAPPEDEVVEVTKVATAATAEYRPGRMGLGCSNEMIQERISMNAKKARLEKLLKSKTGTDDGLEASGERSFVAEPESDDEKRSSAVKRKVGVDPVAAIAAQAAIRATEVLSKTQKKRRKQQMKKIQNSLVPHS